MADSIAEEEKSMRLQILLDRQREIQRVNYAKRVGTVLDAMVEGHNAARGQVVGRTTQNITPWALARYGVANISLAHKL